MPRVNEKQAKAVTPEYQLTLKLIEAFRETWNAKYAENLADPVTFSRYSVIAMSQLAAITAVDVGMNVDQFTAVCKANFEQAFKNAPRFV